jgi:hypothetical protein
MLMKWLTRLAFPALGLLVALIFFGLNDPVNAPSEGGAAATSGEIPAFEGLVPSPIRTEGPEIVFKWQDTHGGWHYADSPPETGRWNALAIERADKATRTNTSGDPSTDWQSPYRAPFFMDSDPADNGS